MHFVLPPRKPSHSAQYFAPRTRNTSLLRRIRLRPLAGVIVGLLFLIVLLSKIGTGSGSDTVQNVIPPGTPHVVLVTTLDPSSSEEHKRMILENRNQYAALHGYAVYLPSTTDYPLRVPKIAHSDAEKPQAQPAIPSSWSKIPAVRHAMNLFPHSVFYLYLDRTAMITNASLSIEEHITNKVRLESLMIPDQPIVPPESVIRTLHARRASHVDFIVTQDSEGLSQSSFIVRRTEWAKYFLDAWYDPLYRSYNFQRAERHALEHLVQWHGTILARLALVPQTIMNAYAQGQAGEKYEDGMFVVNLKGCDLPSQESCESGLKPYYDTFRASLPAGS